MQRVALVAASFAATLMGADIASASVISRHHLSTTAGIRHFQRSHHLQVDGVLGHQTAQAALGHWGARPGPLTSHDRRALGLPAVTRARTNTSVSAGGHAGGILAAIRACESGGNYSTNTGNGFYGAYQFTIGTFQAMGGHGRPDLASPAEQDAAAARLVARGGVHSSTGWPNCP